MGDWITLSKWLPQLIYPFNLALWLLLAALLLMMLRRRRTAMASLFLATVVLAIFSSPLSLALYRQHERTYLPVPVTQSPTAEAIVLLGGDVGIPLPPRVESQVSGNRALHALRLYQAGKAPLIVITGGNVFPQRDVEAEAAYTADILKRWGVPEEDIVVEKASRNTRENAVTTRRLLSERGIDRILLVTAAFHMPRALPTFRHTGFDVVPSPSGYSIVAYRRPALLDWWPTLGNLGKAQALMKEKLGILVYRFRGWMD